MTRFFFFLHPLSISSFYISCINNTIKDLNLILTRFGCFLGFHLNSGSGFHPEIFPLSFFNRFWKFWNSAPFFRSFQNRISEHVLESFQNNVLETGKCPERVGVTRKFQEHLTAIEFWKGYL